MENTWFVNTQESEDLRFKNTPYHWNNILRARQRFKEIFDRYPSRALLSLHRKCQLAVHRSHHQNHFKTFSNNYFTDLNKHSTYPEVPQIVLQSIADVTDETARPGISAEGDLHALPDEVDTIPVIQLSPSEADTTPVIQLSSAEDDDVILVSEIPVDSVAMVTAESSAKQTTGGRKRKLPDDEGIDSISCSSPVTTKPIRDQSSGKRARHEINNVRQTELIWQCDLCEMKFVSREGMNEHLQVRGHYSASVLGCEQIDGQVVPVSVLQPAVLKNLPAIGKNALPICPDVSCGKVFHDIYACSRHFSSVHGHPSKTRYALFKVEHENNIKIYKKNRCFCGERLGTEKKLVRHVFKCAFKKEIDNQAFLVFICHYCSELFRCFIRAKNHVIRCSHRGIKKNHLRALYSQIPPEHKDHLPL